MNILIDGQTLHTPEINRGIGVVFKNVIVNLLKLNLDNDYFITVSTINDLYSLDDWCVDKLTVIENKAFNPNNANCELDKNAEYTDKLNEVIKEHNIDLYWNMNPLMLNVLFPQKELNCKVLCTVHDLIPCVLPFYKEAWESDDVKEYDRRIEYLKNEDVHILNVSNATLLDVKRFLKREKSLYVVTSAADFSLFYRSMVVKNSIDKSEHIIMYTGGFDYRKNMELAIISFSKFIQIYAKEEFVSKTKFYIVCMMTDEAKIEFENKLRRLNILDKVILTGYISDLELSELYAKADLFYFPSKYEGFGLPILEAFLSGTRVLAARNSAIEEVASSYADYCNENDENDMADNLYRSLKSALNEDKGIARQRQNYAKEFSWIKTAKKSLEVIKKIVVRESISVNEGRKKLAIFTPWPPQKSGIATYIFKLVPFLNRYYDIGIFFENSKVLENAAMLKIEGIDIFSIDRFDDKSNEYDIRLFQIGNNLDYHKKIFGYFMKYNGIVELHDYVIHPFIYGTFFESNKDLYKEILEKSYGSDGLKHFNEIVSNKSQPEMFQFPMAHYLPIKAEMLIVHNWWSYRELGKKSNIKVIPLATFSRLNNVSENIELFKRKYNILNDEYVVACFGFVNKNKRPEKIINTVKKLKKKGYKLKMVFFGECALEEVYRMVRDENLEDIVNITGFLSEDEYQIALEISDIIVNLRYPSMGEASATLCEAFGKGKPVLVSNIAQYKEYPNDICWKVDIGDKEEQQLERMLEYLMGNKSVRVAMGDNAKWYAENVISAENIIEIYKDCLV